jgi:uncharacterized membrane protein
MPISFRCPECDQLLRVPDDAAGKQARCPSCETVAIVRLDSIDPRDLPTEAGKSPPNPFADPNPANPYSSPRTAPDYRPESVSAGPLTHDIIDVGQVLNVSWEVYKDNWATLVGGFTIFTVITGGVSTVLQLMIESTVGRGQGGLDEVIATILEFVISQSVQAFLVVGLTRIYLAAARGQKTSIDMLFSGTDLFWPAFGASILFGLIILAGSVLCIVPGIFLACGLWLFCHLIVDRGVGPLNSFSLAWQYSEGNRMSSFVLGIIQIGVIILGFLALCIGLLFTMTFAGIMWTVAYLHITGQRVASRHSI